MPNHKPAAEIAPDPVLRETSVAEFLSFYDRRGYGDNDTGLGVRPAVLVIDFSNAFTKGTPEFPTGAYDRQIAETARLLDVARGAAPVYFTTIAYEPHMADAGLWVRKIPWLKALGIGTEGVMIDDRLGPASEDQLIVKKFASSFAGTTLAAQLEKDGIDTLIIAGCTTSVCVRATTVDAMERGYRTVLAEECVGDLNPMLHAIHLADLRARYADVVSLSEILHYLQKERA